MKEDASTAFRRLIRMIWSIKARFAVTAALFFVLAVQPAKTLRAKAPQTDEARDYAARGISLAREGNLPQAQQQLEQAANMAPEVALYRAQLASIHERQTS